MTPIVVKLGSRVINRQPPTPVAEAAQVDNTPEPLPHNVATTFQQRRQILTALLRDWVDMGMDADNLVNVAEAFASEFGYEEALFADETPTLPYREASEHLFTDPSDDVNRLRVCMPKPKAVEKKGRLYGPAGQSPRRVSPYHVDQDDGRKPRRNCLDKEGVATLDHVNRVLREAKLGIRPAMKLRSVAVVSDGVPVGTFEHPYVEQQNPSATIMQPSCVNGLTAAGELGRVNIRPQCEKCGAGKKGCVAMATCPDYKNVSKPVGAGGGQGRVPNVLRKKRPGKSVSVQTTGPSVGVQTNPDDVSDDANIRLRPRGGATRKLESALREIQELAGVVDETSSGYVKGWFRALCGEEAKVNAIHRVKLLDAENDTYDFQVYIRFPRTQHDLCVSLRLLARLKNYMIFRARDKATPLSLRAKCAQYSKEIGMTPEQLVLVMPGSIVASMYAFLSERAAYSALGNEAGRTTIQWSELVKEGIVEKGDTWLQVLGKVMLIPPMALFSAIVGLPHLDPFVFLRPLQLRSRVALGSTTT